MNEPNHRRNLFIVSEFSARRAQPLIHASFVCKLLCVSMFFFFFSFSFNSFSTNYGDPKSSKVCRTSPILIRVRAHSIQASIKPKRPQNKCDVIKVRCTFCPSLFAAPLNICTMHIHSFGCDTLFAGAWPECISYPIVIRRLLVITQLLLCARTHTRLLFWFVPFYHYIFSIQLIFGQFFLLLLVPLVLFGLVWYLSGYEKNMHHPQNRASFETRKKIE